MVDLKCIGAVDPELYGSMVEELRRQQHNLELIASENIVSPAVMAAAGSFYTNKYAEGYPRKRYYGGCQFVDRAEELAIERAKELFGVKFANVQAHSGSNANFAVYYAVLQPGDTVLGMSLSEGGHLTHGSPVNLSGKLFRFVSYGLDPETGRIDYDDVRKKALEYKPKLIVAGASAYARTRRRTRAPSSSTSSAPSRTKSGLISWWTSRTSRASSRRGCIPLPCRMRTL